VNGAIRHAYIEKIKARSKEQRLLALAALRDRDAPVGKKRRNPYADGGSRRRRRAKSKAATATAKKRGRSKRTTYKAKPKAKGGKRGKLRTVKRRK
jgi:hypothetical protein